MAFEDAVQPVSKRRALRTSHQAAVKAAPRALGAAIRGLVEVGATVTGLTPDEAADRCMLDHLSMRPRFTQMRQKGWLEDTGLERKSGHGQMQAVLKITAKGRDELARRKMDGLSRLLEQGKTEAA